MSGEEPGAPERKKRHPLRIVGAYVAVLAATAFGSFELSKQSETQPAKTPTVATTAILGSQTSVARAPETALNTTSTSRAVEELWPTTSSLSPETTQRLIKPFEAFRSPEPLPPNLKDLLAQQMVAVQGLGDGSGLIINGYLVSAAHVARDKKTGKGSNSLTYSFWQDNFATQYSAAEWFADPTTDLLVARLPADADTSHEWFVPFFANDPPQPGQRFAIAGFPGGAQKPVEANLTFLGLDNTTGDLHDQYVFAADPDNDPESVHKACMFGASGSIIMDGYGDLAVLTGVNYKYALDGKPDPTWTQTMLQESDHFGVDLSQTQLLCYATPVTRNAINLFIAGFNDGK